MSFRHVGFMILPVVAMAGCSTGPQSPQASAALAQSASDTMKLVQQKDPSLPFVLRRSAGYAVFPSVGTLSVGLSGTSGKGDVYERGRLVGYSDLSQGSINMQLGIQNYTEIVCFQTHDALVRFERGQYTPEIDPTPIKSGSGAAARYMHGVAVFTMDPQGQPLVAPIGGQQFTYQKK